MYVCASPSLVLAATFTIVKLFRSLPEELTLATVHCIACGLHIMLSDLILKYSLVLWSQLGTHLDSVLCVNYGLVFDICSLKPYNKLPKVKNPLLGYVQEGMVKARLLIVKFYYAVDEYLNDNTARLIIYMPIM